MRLSFRARMPKGSNSALALVCGPNGHEGWWIWLNMYENSPKYRGWLCTSLLSGSPTWKDALVMAGLWHPLLPKVIPMPAPTLPQKGQLMPWKGTGYLPSSLPWGVLGPGGLLHHPQSLGCLSVPTYHEHCVGGWWLGEERRSKLVYSVAW